jgi:hypothetical protein
LQRWPEALSLSDRAASIWSDLVERNPSVQSLKRSFDMTFKDAVSLAEQAGEEAAAQSRRQAAENFWRNHPSIDSQGK